MTDTSTATPYFLQPDNGDDEGGQQQPASSAPPPQPTRDPSTDAMRIQQQDAGQQAPTQVQPVSVTPVRRGGLAGIVDEMRDALAGKTQQNIYQAPDGSKYVQQDPLTHGQQWARIVGTALKSGAAGLAAGQGPGGMARSAEAGIQAEEKQAEQRRQQNQQQSAEARQSQLDLWNGVKLKHDIAAQEFALKRMQVQAQQGDVEFAQKQVDRERGLGSADLGTYKDPADLSRVQQQDPDFWKNVYKNNIVTVPEYDEDGNRAGIHVFLRTPGVGSQLVPKGTQVMDFVPGEKPGDAPQLVGRTLTIPATNDQVDAWNAANIKKYNDFFKEKADADAKQADIGLKHEQTATQRTEQQKNRAEAGKASAEETKTKNETIGPGGTGSPTVDLIGQGRATVSDLSRIIAKEPGMLDAVTQKYPDFDPNKIKGYVKASEEYASTKPGSAGAALNAGATAIRHLAELKAMNTVASHIPGTPAYNAYMNKVDTLADELGKFYGDATVSGREGYKSTLASTLPGTRDKAIQTQAESMGVKFDQYEQSWRNAAPSAAYQRPMPNVGLDAKEARAQLDPNYAKTATVRMKAPTGETSDVPLAQVKHYMQQGATVDE